MGAAGHTGRGLDALGVDRAGGRLGCAAFLPADEAVLISATNTGAVYKLDKSTGAVHGRWAASATSSPCPAMRPASPDRRTSAAKPTAA